MKVRPTVFRMARAAITAAVIFAVASCCVADAQTPATASDAAVKPSALPAVQAPGLPHGAGEVLKMYQAGIDKNIIIRYIESTSLPYHLSADGIIYLQSLGVPQDITKAMIVRDGQLQQQQPVNSQYFPQQPMQGAVPPGYPPYGGMGQQPPTQIVTPTTPAPAVDYGAAVDYGDYTDYGAGYPYYGYPYYGYAGWPYYGYYGWPGWGWGWGWGGRGWGWGWGGRGWGYGGYRGGYGGFRGGVGGIRGGGGFRAGVGGFHGGAAGGFHGGGGGGGFHGGAMGGGGHGGGGGHR